MHDAVQGLAAKGNISGRDAALLFALCSRKEIHEALHGAYVWELRDRKFNELRGYLNGRLPPAVPAV
jgi:hypothetical protein